MTSNDVVTIRLLNQQLTSSKFEKPEGLVSWMGALQAQDFPMARWAVGLRLPGSDESNIIKALDDGKIIRTHVLRPTWHLVSSEDIYWMLELSAPNIFRSMKSRHQTLGISNNILKKSNQLIEKLLETDEFVTREEIIQQWGSNKIPTDENRAAHLLFSAELEGLICSGKIKNNRQTYSLLERRVERKKTISREEALIKLAEKYFQSHSPASISDFIWWSGLTAKDARTAVELAGSKLIREKINNIDYYLSGDRPLSKKIPKVILLPAYDEFIISYKERNHTLNSNGYKKVISNNGIFKPVVLIRGKAAGIWKRSLNKNDITIEISLFQLPDERTKKLIDLAAARYSRYLNQEVSLKYVR